MVDCCGQFLTLWLCLWQLQLLGQLSRKARLTNYICDNWQTINHLTKSSVSGAPTPPPSAWVRAPPAPPWFWPPETRPASCRHPDQVKTEENVKKNKHDICNNRQYTITQHNNMLPALLDVFMSSINFISPNLLSWDFLCVWWIVKQRTGYSNRLMLLSFFSSYAHFKQTLSYSVST